MKVLKEKEFTVLQLDDNYRIISDKLNWILEKYEAVIDLKTKQPNGEYKWKTLGYFGNKIDHALKYYVTDSLRNEGSSNVNNLINKLNELSSVIERQVKRENIKLPTKNKDDDSE